MNPIIRFYTALLAYFKMTKAEANKPGEAETILDLASKCKLGWEVTEERINELRGYCRFVQSGRDDSAVSASKVFDFLITAFKDLSPLKDKRAMVLFNELRKQGGCPLEQHPTEAATIIWGRRVKKTESGGAIITLHVSDLEAFNTILNDAAILSGEERKKDILDEGAWVYDIR
jgi:hypothetical protein